jgi:DNA topoisomerase-1
MSGRLKKIGVDDLDIERRRAGRGFAYYDSTGRQIKDAETLARIRQLAIPPAYVGVRIASDERAHLQAVGRDVAGRLQYRYHPDWTHVREKRKVARIAELVDALPKIRAAVRRDLAAKEFSCAKAAACAIAMIDESCLRVGCEDYAREDGGRGAATLLKRHAKIGRDQIRLQFYGKGGKSIDRVIKDPALAAALRRLATIPGQRLLKYLDEDGRPHPLNAVDVNAYLQRVSGAAVSAKDFRMTNASALAAEELAAISPPAPSETGQRRQLSAVMRLVAEQLCNTPAIARKSYVHAIVEESFRRGVLTSRLRLARPAPFRKRAEALLGELARRESKTSPKTGAPEAGQ